MDTSVGYAKVSYILYETTGSFVNGLEVRHIIYETMDSSVGYAKVSYILYETTGSFVNRQEARYIIY